MIGGPYSMMQVCAWAGMLVSYSQNDGLVRAAKETFSGEKPCALCCKIDAARKLNHGEEEPVVPFAASVSARQLHEMLPTGEIRLVFPCPSDLPAVTFAGILPVCGLVAATPPTPPPRGVA